MELRYNEGEVLQVPNTKLTRQRWKDHMYYGKWIYIVLAIVAVFVTDLLYSTTEYRPPDERKVTVQFVSSSASMAETVEQTTEQILSAVLPMDETLERVEFFALNFSGDDSDYYGAQKFFVELAAGENDVYVGSRAVLNSIIDQGAAIPLDEYIDSGLITVPEGAQLYERREPVFDEQGQRTGHGRNAHLWLQHGSPGANARANLHEQRGQLFHHHFHEPQPGNFGPGHAGALRAVEPAVAGALAFCGRFRRGGRGG